MRGFRLRDGHWGRRPGSEGPSPRSRGKRLGRAALVSGRSRAGPGPPPPSTPPPAEGSSSSPGTASVHGAVPKRCGRPLDKAPGDKRQRRAPDTLVRQLGVVPCLATRRPAPSRPVGGSRPRVCVSSACSLTRSVPRFPSCALTPQGRSCHPGCPFALPPPAEQMRKVLATGPSDDGDGQGGGCSCTERPWAMTGEAAWKKYGFSSCSPLGCPSSEQRTLTNDLGPRISKCHKTLSPEAPGLWL